jgi:acetoin utilization protein AcuB
MIVSMWMTRGVVSIRPDAPIEEAAALMSHHRVRRLPVVEVHGDKSRLVGMISASDIVRAFPPNLNPFALGALDERPIGLNTGEVMTRQVETTTPATPIEEAAAVMRDHKIGALPVMSDQRLVGLITESDIFRALVSLFSLPGQGARITFDMSRGEDVFGLIGQLAKKRGVRVVSLLSTELDNRPECVVRVAGDQVDKFLDDIWASGHTVLNVLRFPTRKAD